MNTAPAVLDPVSDTPISDIEPGIEEGFFPANKRPAAHPRLDRLGEHLQRKRVHKQFAVSMRTFNVWLEQFKEGADELG